jgi:hypothetical protein
VHSLGADGKPGGEGDAADIYSNAPGQASVGAQGQAQGQSATAAAPQQDSAPPKTP